MGEIDVLEGLANHFKGIEAVGGRLRLTDRRLVFESHSLNFQNHADSWALADIAGVRPVRTLGIVPNGIAVRLVDGTDERFVVSNRTAWIRAIASAIGQC